jgi:hypothetical protein
MPHRVGARVDLQLLESDGQILIYESVGMHQNLSPRIDPPARIIVAEWHWKRASSLARS